MKIISNSIKSSLFSPLCSVAGPLNGGQAALVCFGGKMGRPIIDETGNVYGKWTVLERAENAKWGLARWLCRCECGIKRAIPGANLRDGSAFSCLKCSHLRHRIDITGERYSKLVVLEFAGMNTALQTTWLCQCDCGNKTRVSGANLRTKKGNIKSCGCLLRRTGADHPNWNPSRTNEDRKIKRAYPEYKTWRKAVYKRDWFTCQVCNLGGGRFVAHHLYSYADYPEHRLDIDNGITICKRHHDKFHNAYGRGNNTPEQFIDFMNWMSRAVE